MLSISNFSAVIFDMDGLVLDTESTYCMAWQQAAKVMGHALADDFCLALSGLNYKDVERKLLIHCGPGFNPQTFNHLSADYWRQHVNAHGINVKQGFTPLLEWIAEQQIPYCLATNSRAASACECLELAGIANVFATIISRDDVRQGKPEPDIFITAAERLQVDIKRCLVLEDSHAGIVAAARAGAFSVFIPSILPVNPLTVELCDLTVDDLTRFLQNICV